MVRYAKCGGEACAIAVRIARGVDRSRQDSVLRLSRLARLVPGGESDRGSRVSTPICFPASKPLGVPARACGHGDAVSLTEICAALGELLDRTSRRGGGRDHGAAAFGVTPGGISGRRRPLAREHEAVLIFDEVSAGLRFGMGGAQAVVSVSRPTWPCLPSRFRTAIRWRPLSDAAK